MRNDLSTFPALQEDIVPNNLSGSVAITSCKWLQFGFPAPAFL